MLSCPVCKKPAAEGSAVCPQDGARLVDAALLGEGAGSMLQPNTVLGSYRLTGVAGEGGMGRVYAAEHVLLGRKVAVKVLHPDYAGNPKAVRRFFSEARAVNQIHHENIVQITDFVENDPRAKYYVMEFLDGQSLADVLFREGRLAIPRVLRVALQMTRALDAVHTAGIVHRDLKPDNVYLIRHGELTDFVKLLDFGVAKLTDTDTGQPLNQTAAGSLMGTPEYMSPEQAASTGVDHRTDIYSLGVMLFEMIAGRKPFVARSFGELVVKHMTLEPPLLASLPDAPADLPQRLEDLVMRCLAKTPEARPASMAAMAVELKELVETLDEQEVVRRPRRRPRRRSAWLAPVGVAAAVVLAGVGVAVGLRISQNVKPALANAAERPPATPATPAPTPVVVVVESVPPGALVFNTATNSAVGVTPLHVELPREVGDATFELRLEGYEIARQTFPRDEDVRLRVTLAKKPVHTAAGKRAASGKRKPGRKIRKSGVLDPFAND